MNYEEFVEWLKEVITECLKEIKPQMGDVKFYIRKETKINLERDSIVIKADLFDDIQPTLNLNDLYAMYQEMNNEEAFCRHMKKTLQRGIEDMPVKPLHAIKNLPQKVIMQVINTRQNEKFLLTCPHREFLDLSIIYRLYVDSNEAGDYTCIVTNNMMRECNLTEEELYQAAYVNTRSMHPECILDLCELLDLFAEDASSREQIRSVVLTNDNKQFAACYMLYPDILETIAEYFANDLYLLPSSLHELIIIPKHDMEDEAKNLSQIVLEANFTQLLLEERLSNEVYSYSRETKKVSQVTDVAYKALDGTPPGFY